MTPQDKQAFGEAGNLTVNSGTSVTGEFCTIQCIGEVTFTTLVDALEKTTAEYGTAATGTLTFTDVPVADETIEVNSVTYTFKATATAATEIALGTGANAGAKAASTAANVAAAVGANDTAVTATSAAGVVTFTAAAKGTDGNAFTLGESATNCTKSGTALAGGMSLAAASSKTYADGFTLYGKFTTVKPSANAVRLTVASPL